MIGKGKSYFLIILIPKIILLVTASRDVQDICPVLDRTSCRNNTLANGKTLQFIPKLIPPNLDWLTKGVPRCHPIQHDARQFVCTIPACHSMPCLHGGTCEETTTGYSCLCLDGYHGDRCEQDRFIQSFKVLGPGDNSSEGPLALTSRSLANQHVLILQENWNNNYSQMACQYLGFEGSFVTVSGAQYDSVETPDVATVICPDDVMNMTECWTSETKVLVNKNETIAVVCCPVNSCIPSGQPLGIGSNAIPDSAFTESSCVSSYCGSSGRLDGPSSWRPSNSDQSQWMEVQFGYSIVTAVTIQGAHDTTDVGEWVTSFTISSSLDGVTWTDYVNVYSGSVEIFSGNYDKNTHVTQTFVRPIVGQYFRIHPKTFDGYIAIGMELHGYGPLTRSIALLNLDVKLGCSLPVLGEGLGVEDGRIPDSSLTSSTDWGSLLVPKYGRLNSNSAWVPQDSDVDKWVKVDLGEDTLVTGVITQGRYSGGGEMVTSFSISYSKDDTDWIFALEEFCGTRIYPGNFDQETYVTIVFPKPVTARYVKIHPLTYEYHASMRYEVLGINN